MKQTLTLTATTHTAAKYIHEIILGDKALLKIFNPKGSRQIQARADEEDIAALKEELKSKLLIYRIKDYRIEITQDEKVTLKEEIIDIVKRGIAEMGETTPLERLRIIIKLAPELTVAEATPLIEGK